MVTSAPEVPPRDRRMSVGITDPPVCSPELYLDLTERDGRSIRFHLSAREARLLAGLLESGAASINRIIGDYDGEDGSE